MNIRRSNKAETALLSDNTGTVEPVARRGERSVPEKPTTEMLAAGSIVGNVSVATAWNIYQAMLKAAS